MLRSWLARSSAALALRTGSATASVASGASESATSKRSAYMASVGSEAEPEGDRAINKSPNTQTAESRIG